MNFMLIRQSYDVSIHLKLEGTNIESSNTLDLKNPYFRYTGAAVPAPPGSNTTSPSENYWNQLDAQGARSGESNSILITSVFAYECSLKMYSLTLFCANVRNSYHFSSTMFFHKFFSFLFIFSPSLLRKI